LQSIQDFHPGRMGEREGIYLRRNQGAFLQWIVLPGNEIIGSACDFPFCFCIHNHIKPGK
jgi:hypothetical protein